MSTNSITKISSNSQRLIKSILPTSILQTRLHKRIYSQFADKIGLVYFGFVDQRKDEHRLVRGLTTSPSHRDNHYCIGSYKSYDLVLVERHDTVHFPDKPSRHHNWIIMEVDLHSSSDIPHIFIGLHSHSETFYANLFTKFSHLNKLSLGNTGIYDKSFTNKYAIYANQSHILEIEKIFNPEITKLIAKHFGSLTIEVYEGSLYLYAQHQRLTTNLLTTMLQNSYWLASRIDNYSQASTK